MTVLRIEPSLSSSVEVYIFYQYTRRHVVLSCTLRGDGRLTVRTCGAASRPADRPVSSTADPLCQCHCRSPVCVPLHAGVHKNLLRHSTLKKLLAVKKKTKERNDMAVGVHRPVWFALHGNHEWKHASGSSDAASFDCRLDAIGSDTAVCRNAQQQTLEINLLKPTGYEIHRQV